MSKTPFMKMYVSDYLADTGHLSTLEHGAYMLLIFNYWQTGKPLPNDDKILARICRMPLCNFKKILHALKFFFEPVDNFLVHHRIEKELAEFREKSEKSRASVNHRWSKRNTNVLHSDIRTNCDRYTITDNRLQITESMILNSTAEDLPTACQGDHSESPFSNSPKSSEIKNVQEKKTGTKKKSQTVTQIISPDGDCEIKNFAIVSTVKNSIAEVFEFWKSTFHHPKSVLDERRKRLIESRLKNFSVDDLKLAISGCANSEFHMGKNENGKIYDGIDLIFRNSDKVDFFISMNKTIVQKTKSELRRERNISILEKLDLTNGRKVNAN